MMSCLYLILCLTEIFNKMSDGIGIYLQESEVMEKLGKWKTWKIQKISLWKCFKTLGQPYKLETIVYEQPKMSTEPVSTCSLWSSLYGPCYIMHKHLPRTHPCTHIYSTTFIYMHTHVNINTYRCKYFFLHFLMHFIDDPSCCILLMTLFLYFFPQFQWLYLSMYS